ncbi:MAG: hypothetical protein NC131_12390, partial [Roseburia sp.]|nr:hypothetical protein [Roseburia sp.]
NASELKIVCDLTTRSAEEQFSMQLQTMNTEVYGVIFYATFLEILSFIRGKEKIYNNFTIQIAQSLNIGYLNSDDEENEKVGNFMPIMEYLTINRNVVDDGSSDPNKTNNNFMKWKELNTKQNVEFYKEIQNNAYQRLIEEYKINLRSAEGIFPIFCIFLDHIVNVMKMRFREAQGTDVSEVSMNVFGLFDVYYSFDEDENKEIIEFQPNILMKLALKSDELASRE